MSVVLASRLIALVALVAALVLAPVVPPVMTTLVIAAELLAMGLTFPWRGWRELIRRPAVGLPLLAGVLILIALAIDARSPIDVGAFVVILPALMTGPLLSLFYKSRLSLTPQFIGWLGLAGAALGMVQALFESLVLREARAGILLSNPIHFADVSLMAGSFALLGLLGTSRWRYLCILGPLFALIAIALSGSRGALVAIVPQVLIAALMLLRGRRPTSYVWLSLGGVLVAAVLIGGIAYETGGAAMVRLVNGATDMVQTRPDLDGSDVERLEMYQAAWYAFRASPIFGHGLVDFTRIAVSYLPPGLTAPIYEHLHNDIADFAVIGGLVGLVAYLLILAAPLAEAVSTPAGPNRRAAILAAALLSTGYFLMGLTNATFGILPLTVFFPVGGAVVAFLARPCSPSQARP